MAHSSVPPARASGRAEALPTLDSDADSDTSEYPPARDAPAPDRYEVLGEIARGGLGRILEARDRLLDRPVALKELLRDSPTNRARFQREIRFTARLQHPAIVPIYDSGRLADGRDFYAMKLVRGRMLVDAISSAQTMEARLALLPHVLDVADAVAYAHAERVVHRDVKPQNILVGAFGETVLIDWGVAKDLENSEPDEPEAEWIGPGGVTMVGAVVGTPAYMAPEQARGERIDPRADVYALGATLYHLLAGRPPWAGNTKSTLDALRTGALPPPVDALVRGLPPDLVAIIRKAMAADPEDRYPSGQELRQDLRRFSTGQLIAARSYTRAELASRWLHRNRWMVGVVAVAVLLLAVTAVVSVRRVVEERNVAETALALGQSRSNALTLAQARTSVRTDPTEAVAWLAHYPLDGSDWPSVFELALTLNSLGYATIATPADHRQCSVARFSADDRLILVEGTHGNPLDATTGAELLEPTTVRPALQAIVDAEHLVSVSLGTLEVSLVTIRSGAERVLARVPTRPEVVQVVAGAVLVGTQEGELYAVDPATGDLRLLAQFDGRITAIAEKNGGWVASAVDATVRQGTLAGGPPVVLARRDGPVDQLVVTPDGHVVIGDRDGEVSVVGAEGPLLQLPGPVAQLALSADGRLLAAADSGNTLRVLDRTTGTILEPPWGAFRTFGLAFSPVEPLLSATEEDGTLRFWRPLDGTSEPRLGQRTIYSSPAFSHDGSRVATCGMNGTIRVWAAPRLAGEILRGHLRQVFHPVFLADGRVATDSEDTTVRLWDPATGASRALAAHTDDVYGLVPAADGRHLVSIGLDGLGVIWDTLTGEGVSLRGHAGRIRTALWLPGERHVLTGGNDGTLRTWDREGHESSRVKADGSAVFWAVLGPDGKSVITTSADRTLRRWELADDKPGAPATLAEHLGAPEDLAFHPYLASGGRIVVCDGPHALLVLAPGAAPQRVPVPDDATCPSLAVSPDGKTVAVPSGEKISLFDVEQGTVSAFGAHDDEVLALAFSPDGRLLASTSLDHETRVWRLSDGAAYVAHRAESGALGVRFSNDGRSLASTSIDTTAWVGPVDEARLVPRDPAALHAWLATRTTAVFAAVGGP